MGRDENSCGRVALLELGSAAQGMEVRRYKYEVRRYEYPTWIYGLSLHDHHPGDCDDPDAVVFSATKPSELISISGLTACEMSCARSYCNGVVDISGRQHIPCPKACTS